MPLMYATEAYTLFSLTDSSESLEVDPVLSAFGIVTGVDNSNKRCFGTKPKLFRESGDFSGNRDTWKFFRETRDNSGTMQKKIGTSGNVSPKFGRMVQISGTT